MSFSPAITHSPILREATSRSPLMQVIAAKAVAFLEALDPAFTKYQEQVLDNAKVMAKVFLARGYELVSGGTKNHLMLLNLVNKNLTGRAADAALSRAYITVNKNAVPDDPQPASVTSGIRIGTPAITTRGFKQAEAKQVATWICDILDDIDNEEVILAVREKVSKLCAEFPVYG